MFKSKRSILVKELMKIKLQAPESENEAQCQMEILDENENEKAIYRMLKRLKADQLQILLHSVKCKGKEKTSCVMVPNIDVRVNGQLQFLAFLCCKRWRWRDLERRSDLKRLYFCDSDGCDPLYACVNPYHWCRLFNADYPPPPYSSVCPQTKLENHEYETREAESSVGEEAATGDVDSFNHPVYGEAWCILAYWEMLERVGPLVPVWLDNMDVYYDLPQEEGLRLRPLMEARPSNAPACVLKTREKIGSGLCISREGDEVWLYNRSHEYPVFLDSSTLDPPFTSILTVYKIPPGCALLIFDFRKSRYYRTLKPPDKDLLVSHSQYKSVRVSFAKGWSSKYYRTCIGKCPCWLEILFNVKSS